MANTITNLLKDAFTALEIVSREMAGIIPAVTRDQKIEAAAKDVVIRNPVAPKATTFTITPSMTPIANTDLTFTNRTITLDTLKGAIFHFDSEEEMGLRASDPTFDTLFQQNIAQAFRAHIADISNALTALFFNSSRAFGTAGTTPFASDLDALSAAKTMLDVNGAPETDRHFIASHAAANSLLNNTQLTDANRSGGTAGLRQGSVGNVYNFDVRIEDKIKTHTVGTSTGQDANGGEAIGATSITYDGGDGGTILKGDTFIPVADVSGPEGGTSHYVVNTAITAASGEIAINSPGLLATLVDTTELTLGATNYVANLAFSRDALVLGSRPPQGGDAAIDEQIISDPLTGLAFRLAEYRGHHTKNFEVSVLYGVGLGNPEHMVTIFG